MSNDRRPSIEEYDEFGELPERIVTPADIQAFLARFRWFAESPGNGPFLHAAEDRLAWFLLCAIAEGRCENVSECARLATETQEVEISRWYE